MEDERLNLQKYGRETSVPGREEWSGMVCFRVSDRWIIDRVVNRHGGMVKTRFRRQTVLKIDGNIHSPLMDSLIPEIDQEIDVRTIKPQQTIF